MDICSILFYCLDMLFLYWPLNYLREQLLLYKDIWHGKPIAIKVLWSQGNSHLQVPKIIFRKRSLIKILWCSFLFHVFQIFPANVDSKDIAEIPFPEPILTRYIRIDVESYRRYPVMRFEIIGYDCPCPYRGSYNDTHCYCGQGKGLVHRSMHTLL